MTMNYAKYYLNIIDEGDERKRFFHEVGLCKANMSTIYQRKVRGQIGHDPKRMAFLQAKFAAFYVHGANNNGGSSPREGETV